MKMHKDLFVKAEVRLKEDDKVFSTRYFITVQLQGCCEVQYL